MSKIIWNFAVQHGEIPEYICQWNFSATLWNFTVLKFIGPCKISCENIHSVCTDLQNFSFSNSEISQYDISKFHNEILRHMRIFSLWACKISFPAWHCEILLYNCRIHNLKMMFEISHSETVIFHSMTFEREREIKR